MTMKWTDNVAVHQELGKMYTVMRPGFIIELYGDKELIKHGPPILDRIWNLFPSHQEFFYINKHGREYKRVDRQAMARMRKSFSRIDLQPQFYMLKDAPDFDVLKFSAEIELGTDAGRLVIGVPLEFLNEPGADDLEKKFRGLAEEFPFHSGTAGYGFHLVWGRECEMVGMPINIRVASQFLGIGVRHRYQEQSLQRQFKTAHWLTFIGKDLLEKIQYDREAANLDPDVKVTSVRGGVILRAGPKPPVGDVSNGARDIGPMRTVNDFIRPIRITNWRTYNLFNMTEDEACAWLTRLDH